MLADRGRVALWRYEEHRMGLQRRRAANLRLGGDLVRPALFDHRHPVALGTTASRDFRPNTADHHAGSSDHQRIPRSGGATGRSGRAMHRRRWRVQPRDDRPAASRGATRAGARQRIAPPRLQATATGCARPLGCQQAGEPSPDCPGPTNQHRQPTKQVKVRGKAVASVPMISCRWSITLRSRLSAGFAHPAARR